MDSGAGGTGAMGGTPEKTVNDRKSLFFHIQLWMCDVKYSPLTAGAHRDRFERLFHVWQTTTICHCDAVFHIDLLIITYNLMSSPVIR